MALEPTAVIALLTLLMVSASGLAAVFVNEMLPGFPLELVEIVPLIKLFPPLPSVVNAAAEL